MLELFETRYPDFTGQALPRRSWSCEHGFGLSYNWLRLSLQAHGKIKPAPRRGAHRRKRPLADHGGGDDAAPGRLEPRVGCGPVVGPDRDHGRCDIGGLFGLLRCRGGHDEHVLRGSA